MTGFYEGDGTEAEPIPHGLNTHTDVELVGLQDQQVLKYSSSTGNWYNGFDLGGTQLALNDLTDTEVPSPSDGNALVWNSTAAKWVDATIIAGAAGQLSDLSDVQWNGSPAEGEIMLFTGGIWTNGDQAANALIPNPLKVGNDTGEATIVLAAGDQASDSANFVWNRNTVSTWQMGTGGPTIDESPWYLQDNALGRVLEFAKYDGLSVGTSTAKFAKGGAVFGSGEDTSSIGIQLSSGVIQDTDQSFIQFTHGEEGNSPLNSFRIDSTVTIESSFIPFQWDLTVKDRLDQNILRFRTNGLTDETDASFELTDLYVGLTADTNLRVTGDSFIKLTDQTTENAFRNYVNTSGGINELKWSDVGTISNTAFSWETRDNNDVARETRFETNGNWQSPGVVNSRPQVAGDPSGFYVNNYNWNSGDSTAGYHIYALNGSGVDTVLTIAPTRPTNFAGGSQNYTGEVEIRVGDVPNGFFTWSFGSDGALWRNGIIVIPAP